MVPDIYTVILFQELEYQKRLPDVADDRLTSGAQPNKTSLLARLGMASRVATGWLDVRRLLESRLRQPTHIAPLAMDPGPAERSTA